MEGWTCPNCGAGCAPTTQSCPRCSGQTFVIYGWPYRVYKWPPEAPGTTCDPPPPPQTVTIRWATDNPVSEIT